MTPGRQCHPCPPGPTLLPALNFQLLGTGSSSQSLGSNSSQGWEAGECSALRISPAHTLSGCQSCSELAAKATAWSLWGGFGVQPPGEQPKQGISMCSHRERGDGCCVCPPAQTGSSGGGTSSCRTTTAHQPKRGQFPAPSRARRAVQHVVTTKMLPRTLPLVFHNFVS